MIINKIDFPMYNIIVILSVLIGIIYILLSLYNDKLLNKKIIIFIIMFFIFSFFGGKLYTYILYDYGTSLLKSSLSSYGGLAFGIIAAIIYEKLFKEKNVIKYTILSLPLIYSFTKIACAINGCCYGIKYDGFLSVTYPHVMNESLFPVQFLEVIVFFGLFIILNTNKNRKDIEYITLLLISVLKYLVEFLRFERINVINQNQIFSIILFSITLLLYIINHKRHRHS